VLKAKGVATILASLRTYADNLRIQTQGLWTLRNLTLSLAGAFRDLSLA